MRSSIFLRIPGPFRLFLRGRLSSLVLFLASSTDFLNYFEESLLRLFLFRGFSVLTQQISFASINLSFYGRGYLFSYCIWASVSLLFCLSWWMSACFWLTVTSRWFLSSLWDLVSSYEFLGLFVFFWGDVFYLHSFSFWPLPHISCIVSRNLSCGHFHFVAFQPLRNNMFASINLHFYGDRYVRRNVVFFSVFLKRLRKPDGFVV